MLQDASGYAVGHEKSDTWQPSCPATCPHSQSNTIPYYLGSNTHTEYSLHMHIKYIIGEHTMRTIFLYNFIYVFSLRRCHTAISNLVINTHM